VCDTYRIPRQTCEAVQGLVSVTPERRSRMTDGSPAIDPDGKAAGEARRANLLSTRSSAVATFAQTPLDVRVLDVVAADNGMEAAYDNPLRGALQIKAQVLLDGRPTTDVHLDFSCVPFSQGVDLVFDGPTFTMSDGFMSKCQISAYRREGATQYFGAAFVDVPTQRSTGRVAARSVPNRTAIGLSGVVRDGDGAPMSEVAVTVAQRVSRGQTAQIVTSRTSSDGAFSVGGLHPGEYGVTISKEGYIPYVLHYVDVSFRVETTVAAQLRKRE